MKNFIKGKILGKKTGKTEKIGEYSGNIRKKSENPETEIYSLKTSQ